MISRPSRTQSRLYRLLLAFYPPSFRREYGTSMAQAFSADLAERGATKTWMLIVPDLFSSIPEQILEASIMSQKWLATLTAIGAVAMLTAIAIGGGPPILLVGALFCVASLASFVALRRSGRPTEFLYGGVAPAGWKWWTVLAALLATAYVLAGVGQLIDVPKATNVGALGIFTAFAAMIVLGLRLRSRSRISGNWLVIAATAPALMFFWIIVPAVVGLAIIFGAAVELAGASPKAPLPV